MNTRKYFPLMIFLFNLLTADTSSVKSQFFYSMSLRFDDSLNETANNITVVKKENNYKSPAKAMFFSGILPGLGQGYLGKWKRSFLYIGIEALALGTWYKYNGLGEEHKIEYQNFANENWSFARWIRDYYKWLSQENDFYEPFADYETPGCEESGCYPDIWKESHGLSFRWSNPNTPSDEYPYEQYLPFITTNTSGFELIYADLCGNSSSGEKACNRSEEDIIDSLNAYETEIVRDHHFYENIGKYDPFFSGWSDTDSIYVYEKVSGELLAMSPNRRKYRNLWEKTNDEYFKVAGYSLSVILTNHVVSMFDAFLSAKFHNINQKINISARPYYSPNTKSGLGGVKLSLHFKW